MQTKKSIRRRLKNRSRKFWSNKGHRPRNSIRRRLKNHCRPAKIQKAIQKAQKTEIGISKYGLLNLLQYCPNFLGVYSEDQLASLSISSFPSFIIVNIDTSKSDGSHWLSVRLSPDEIEIFDPLGFQIIQWPRIPCTLLSFLHRWTVHRHLRISPPIQSTNSILCGYYCIGYVLYRHFISLDSFVDFFSSSEENDETLLNIF